MLLSSGKTTESHLLKSRSILRYISNAVIVLQYGFALMVLCMKVEIVKDLQNNAQCSVPWKLTYQNLAATVTFAMGILLPVNIWLDKQGKWYFKVWLCATFSFIVLWATAVGTSFLTCADLCSACVRPSPFTVKLASQMCQCTASGASSTFERGSAIVGSLINLDRIRAWYVAIQSLDGLMLASLVISATLVPLFTHITIPKVINDEESTNSKDHVETESSSMESVAQILPPPPAYQAPEHYSNLVEVKASVVR